MAEKYAVIDVDGTTFKSSCVEKVTDVCVAEGLFSATAFAEARAKRERWQTSNNEGLYQSYLHSLVGGFVSEIVGVEVSAFNKAVRQMVEAHQVRRFGFTRALLSSLRDTHTIIAISGSPQMVVEPFLADLDIDHVIGSQFGTVNGVFTDDIASVDKEKAFRKIAGDVDPDVVIGDTVGDLSLLTQALRPIAFNPSATLRQHAVKAEWPIVTENKDAIYQFLPRDGTYHVVFDRDPRIILGEVHRG